MEGDAPKCTCEKQEGKGKKTYKGFGKSKKAAKAVLKRCRSGYSLHRSTKRCRKNCAAIGKVRSKHTGRCLTKCKPTQSRRRKAPRRCVNKKSKRKTARKTKSGRTSKSKK
jgi:hypothetical protein